MWRPCTRFLKTKISSNNSHSMIRDKGWGVASSHPSKRALITVHKPKAIMSPDAPYPPMYPKYTSSQYSNKLVVPAKLKEAVATNLLSFQAQKGILVVFIKVHTSFAGAASTCNFFPRFRHNVDVPNWVTYRFIRHRYLERYVVPKANCERHMFERDWTVCSKYDNHSRVQQST